MNTSWKARLKMSRISWEGEEEAVVDARLGLREVVGSLRGL